jgi:GNAT superfamily N-acetyltransferase
MRRLRRIEAGEGRLLQRVRLAALADSPDAFSSTLAREAAFADEEWAARAAASSSGVSRMTVFAEDGRDVLGLIGGYRETDASTTVELVSMWVHPNARRAGVGRDLVQAVIDWARETSASEVALGVIRGNEAAEGLYEAMGFSPTGETTPLSSNPSLVEVRMATSITSP